MNTLLEKTVAETFVAAQLQVQVTLNGVQFENPVVQPLIRNSDMGVEVIRIGVDRRQFLPER